MIEVNVKHIVFDPTSDRHIIILKGQATDRCLAMLLDTQEASAIAIQIQGRPLPRPMTHDLIEAVIRQLGASVNSMIIDSLRGDVFHGKLILDTGQGQVVVDSRPSDAMAIALRTSAPIYVEQTVMREAGLRIDPETGEVYPPEMDGDCGPTEEQESRLDIFRKYLDSLDLDNMEDN